MVCRCRGRFCLRRKEIILFMVLLFIYSIVRYFPSTDIYTYEFKKANATMLLIVGYMRSGSSLTGDILQQAPNSFYVFEPVHDVTEVIKSKQPVKFLDGSKRFFNESELTEVHSNLLYHWFTCNLTELDLGSLVHNDMVFYSKSTISYYKCHHRYKGYIPRVKQCLWYLLNRCYPATFRSLKVIRISMNSVEYLLEKLPNLKVIHLLRDPRAILHSQIKARLIHPRELPTQAKEYCSRMVQDAKTTEKLLDKFPGRIKPLLYENLADDPIVLSRKLYQYAGLDYSYLVDRYVKEIAVSGRSWPCLFCTHKGNSAKTAHNWRTSVNFTHITMIDEYCQAVYEKVGYIYVSTEKRLRNSSFPLRKLSSFSSRSL